MKCEDNGFIHALIDLQTGAGAKTHSRRLYSGVKSSGNKLTKMVIYSTFTFVVM